MAKDVEADTDTLSWANMLLASLWPKANAALIRYVRDELNPLLQGLMPKPLKGMRFARFTLGKGVPQFGSVEVMRHEESHVQLECDLRYFSDVDLLLEAGAGGISFGISQLHFMGRLCLAIKPLLSRWPVVGGVHFFFANQPLLEMKFAGLAHTVAEFPGIAHAVQDVVSNLLRSKVVLPNFLSFHLTKDEQILNLTEASSLQPLGVLCVQVRRARCLAGANWQVGPAERFTSHPYCVLRLGTSESRTSTVKGSTSPDWPADEPSAYFVVYHHEQELEIDVFHESGGVLRRSFVSSLGRVPAISVRTLLDHAKRGAGELRAQEHHRLVLDTSQVKRGMLHVNDPVNVGIPSEIEFAVDWLDIAAPTLARGPPRQPPPVDAPLGLLLVELHAGAGFPEGRGGLQWQCHVEHGRQPPARSQTGTHHHEESDFANLPLDRCMLPVVERLVERGLPVPDIADIVNTTPDVVLQYLAAKEALLRRAEQRLREPEGERLVEMRWNQTIPLLVWQSAGVCLNISLLEGDKVVGHLNPISVRQVEGCSLPRAAFKLRPARQAAAGDEGLWSWIFPYCNRQVTGRSRYRAVSMEISVRFQHLVRGSVPRTVGAAHADAATDDQGWRPKAAAPPAPARSFVAPAAPPEGNPGGWSDGLPAVAKISVTATAPTEAQDEFVLCVGGDPAASAKDLQASPAGGAKAVHFAPDVASFPALAVDRGPCAASPVPEGMYSSGAN